MLDKTSVLLSYVVLRWSSRCHPHDGVSQGPTEVLLQAMRAGGINTAGGTNLVKSPLRLRLKPPTRPC